MRFFITLRSVKNDLSEITFLNMTTLPAEDSLKTKHNDPEDVRKKLWTVAGLRFRIRPFIGSAV